MNARTIAMGALIAAGVGIIGYMGFFMKMGAMGGMEMASVASVGALPAGTFESEHVGLRFDYPGGYAQALTHIDEGRPGEYHQVVFVQGATTTPQGGEAPPAIAIAGIDVPNNTNLEQWVKTDKRSNFYLSPDKKLTPTTVGGRPALAYRYSGLYEHDAVAAMDEGRMFVFDVSWIGQDDQIRKDFDAIIKSVTFLPPEDAY